MHDMTRDVTKRDNSLRLEYGNNNPETSPNRRSRDPAKISQKDCQRKSYQRFEDANALGVLLTKNPVLLL